MKTIRELTIPRKLWGMGQLRDPADGKMCCLGHLAKACGVPDIKMNGIGLPTGMIMDTPRMPRAFRDGEFEADNIAAGINDHKTMRRSEKEYRLKILFRAYGIRLTFTD